MMQAEPSTAPAHAAAPASPDVLQCLRIALGADSYAVRLDAVREILEVVQMTPLPLMPAFVRGVMNLRGAVVPVIDLSARLGMPATVIGRRTCVVIVDVPALVQDERDGADSPGNRQTLGVLVDAVYEVFDIHAHDTEPVPRLGMRIDPSFVRSITRVHGKATPELQLENILEQQTLARMVFEHGATH